jgi:site-specific recombinase XerD
MYKHFNLQTMIPNYPKFREWLTLKGYSSATVGTILRQTTDFLAWAVKEELPEPGGLSYNDLMQYVQTCQQRGVAQKTIAHYVSDLRKLFDFLISEGMGNDNPAAFIKLRGIKRRVYHAILSPQELQRLYQQYPVVIRHEPGKIIPPQERNQLSRQRNKVMVGLLVNQGLRVEELKALTLQDLQLREGRITIHHQRRTSERVLELEAAQVYELMDYLATTRKQLLQHYGEMTDELFIQHHQAGNFYGVTAVLLKHLRQINPAVKNLDQLRASVITHWVKGYDLRKAQYMAGHRYVSSTEAYKQQLLDELQADVKKFHPF